MDRRITLALTVGVDPARVFEILSTTEGQRAFWTADCDVGTDHARFGFTNPTVEISAHVMTVPNALVRMRAISGLTTTEIWEWELKRNMASATDILFRHYGFGESYPERELGRCALDWARILDRLANYIATGRPQPYFPCA